MDGWAPAPSYTVKGKWTWNDSLNLTKFFTSGTGESITNVNCTVDGKNYHTVVVDSYGNRMPNYITLNGDDTITICNSKSTNTSVPIFAEYKIIDFGEEEQEVPQDFYNGLVANAIQQEEPVVPTTIKSVSNKNLTKFKQNCDNTYAKIGEVGEKGERGYDGQTLYFLDTPYSSSHDAIVGRQFSFNIDNIRPDFPRLADINDYFTLIWDKEDGSASYYCFAQITIADEGNSSGTIVALTPNLKGATGTNGTNGTNGKDALETYYSHSDTTAPSVGNEININVSNFNRAPVDGDSCFIQWKNTTDNKSYAVGLLCSIGASTGVATFLIQTVTETTGAQGPSGSSSIEYMTKEEVDALFN